MRFIILTLLSLHASNLLAKDARQGVYVPPKMNDHRLKQQIVRMTLGDNEQTAIVKYKYGSITRLVFPTDTNTASCEVDSTIIKVENTKKSESVKGKNMFFRRVNIKTHEGAASDFKKSDDKILEDDYIKLVCTYERFNVTYERVIMVRVSAEKGYGVVFFEHPHDRFYQEYEGLNFNSVREIVYDKKGTIIKDRKKELDSSEDKQSQKPAFESNDYPILVVPVDSSKAPYWGDKT